MATGARASLILLLILLTSSTVHPRQPNVVLIVSDDQGYGDIGSHGNDVLATPELDRLASQGLELTRFYVSPSCAPSRASLLTGRYHLRTGVWGVSLGREDMNEHETTIAEIFRSAGYRTGHFGKWHNGRHFPRVPHGQGFDEFVGFRGGGWPSYFDVTLERNGTAYPTTGYIADVLTDEVLAFIEENEDRRFFAYFPINTPHDPLQLPESFHEPFVQIGVPEPDARIYGMIANLDWNIGRILDKLDELSLGNDTIVVFLSDNGPNSDRYNSGLRERKGSVYEGGCRVPSLIRWPGHLLPAGTKIDTIAAHIDLLPTLAQMCDISLPADLRLDGLSLAPILQGSSSDWPDRKIFSHQVSHQATTGDVYPGTVRTQQHNLVNGTELYDVMDDPGESIDLAAELPGLVAELSQAYQQWYEDVVDGQTYTVPAVPVGYADEPVVSLWAPYATLEGSLEFFGNGFTHDWLTNWSGTEDIASWRIDVVQAGTYQVSLSYRCETEEIGSVVQIEVAGQQLQGTVSRSTEPTPDRVPRNEGGFNLPIVDWLTLELGSVRLPEGPQVLTVTATDIADEQAMDLQAAILKRVTWRAAGGRHRGEDP